MVMQFIRAKKRQKLVRKFDPAELNSTDQHKWVAVENSFDFMFKDFRKLQILKRNTDSCSHHILEKLGQYRKFSRLEMLVTSSMILFGLTAHLFCE
jgi:hypothetical protein